MNRRFLILLLSFTFSAIDLNAQDYRLENQYYNQLDDQERLAELKSQYGNNKKYPDSVEIPFLIALAHYPELIETRIKVKYSDKKIAHTSAPNWWSYIIPFIQPSYRITISKNLPAGLKNSMYSHLSYNARIGVLGHELAHTSYYEQKSKMGILIMGLMYINKRYRARLERDTDKMAIDHNLGPQLMEWSREVHEVHMQDGRGHMYLSVEEIMEYMKQKKEVK